MEPFEKWLLFLLGLSAVFVVTLFGVAQFAGPTIEPTPPPVHVQFSTSCPCDCQPPRVTIYDYGQLAPPYCATYEDLPEPPPAAKECPDKCSPGSCSENGCLLPKFQPLPEKCPPKCPPKKLGSPCRP